MSRARRRRKSDLRWPRSRPLFGWSIGRQHRHFSFFLFHFFFHLLSLSLFGRSCCFSRCCFWPIRLVTATTTITTGRGRGDTFYCRFLSQRLFSGLRGLALPRSLFIRLIFRFYYYFLFFQFSNLAKYPALYEHQRVAAARKSVKNRQKPAEEEKK